MDTKTHNEDRLTIATSSVRCFPGILSVYFSVSMPSSIASQVRTPSQSGGGGRLASRRLLLLNSLESSTVLMQPSITVVFLTLLIAARKKQNRDNKPALTTYPAAARGEPGVFFFSYLSGPVIGEVPSHQRLTLHVSGVSHRTPRSVAPSYPIHSCAYYGRVTVKGIL